MLGNTGDDLSNMWGLISTGLAVGGLGFVLMHRGWRWAFYTVGGILILAGLCWAPLRHYAPALAGPVTALTANPSNWFLVLFVLLLSLVLHQWRKEMKTENSVTLRDAKTVVSQEERARAALRTELYDSLRADLASTPKAGITTAQIKGWGVNWDPWKWRSKYDFRIFQNIGGP